MLCALCEKDNKHYQLLHAKEKACTRAIHEKDNKYQRMWCTKEKDYNTLLKKKVDEKKKINEYNAIETQSEDGHDNVI